MRHFLEHATMQPAGLFLLGTAGKLAAGSHGTPRPGGHPARLTPTCPHAPQHLQAPILPAPKPIPGGTDFPPFPPIHWFGPGPETITLPFTLFTLQGLHVEPSVITDFKGVTALAYHVGTATGSDGLTYNLETDVRVSPGHIRRRGWLTTRGDLRGVLN